MSLSVTVKPGAIFTPGGAELKAQERNADGTALSAPDTVHNFGKVKESGFRDKTPLTPLYDEENKKVATEEGQRDTGFTAVLWQRDAQTIDDLRNEVRGKYYLTMRKLSPTKNGYGFIQREFSFGQFHADVEFKIPFVGIEVNFEGEIIDTAISLTPGELSSWVGNTTSMTATVTILAADWTKIAETVN